MRLLTSRSHRIDKLPARQVDNPPAYGEEVAIAREQASRALNQIPTFAAETGALAKLEKLSPPIRIVCFEPLLSALVVDGRIRTDSIEISPPRSTREISVVVTPTAAEIIAITAQIINYPYQLTLCLECASQISEQVIAILNSYR